MLVLKFHFQGYLILSPSFKSRLTAHYAPPELFYNPATGLATDAHGVTPQVGQTPSLSDSSYSSHLHSGSIHVETYNQGGWPSMTEYQPYGEGVPASHQPSAVPQPGDISWAVGQEHAAGSMGQQPAEDPQFWGEAPGRPNEEISQQPRLDQQPAWPTDPEDWEWHLSRTYRQFQSPEGEVYGTTNVTKLAEHLTTLLDTKISINMLRKGDNGWQELTGRGQIPLNQIKLANLLPDPVYVFQRQVKENGKTKTRFVLSDSLRDFTTKEKLDYSRMTHVWRYGRTHKGWTRPAEELLTRMEKDKGIVLQSRKDQQPPRVYKDGKGREWRYYTPVRQFRNPKTREIYATTNVTKLAEHLTTSLGTEISSQMLQKGNRGWEELKEGRQIPLSQIQPENFLADPVYVFQKQEEENGETKTRTVHFDNLTDFAAENSLSHGNISTIWNHGGTCGGWTRPTEEYLTRMEQKEKIGLQPRKDRARR